MPEGAYRMDFGYGIVWYVPEEVYDIMPDVIDDIKTDFEFMLNLTKRCKPYGPEVIEDIIRKIFEVGMELERALDRGEISQEEIADTIYSTKRVFSDVIFQADRLLEACEKRR